MSEKKQPLTHRQVFMLSEAEVTAIDDWRFHYRIPTRARALRTLIGAGLFTSQTLVDALEVAAESLSHSEDTEALAVVNAALLHARGESQ